MTRRRPHPAPYTQRDTGFTLIELLVAVALMMVLSAMAYGGLDAITRAGQQVEAANAHVRGLQMTLFRVAQDLEQARNRPIRDAFGDASAAMQYNRSNPEGPVLEFTRGGRRNPLNRDVSALQRVGFVLVEGELLRLSWPRLDRAQDAEPTRTVMMDDVVDVRWRFLDPEGQWLEQWPPEDPATASPDLNAGLPQVVEMQLESKRWGILRGLYRLSSAVQPART